MTTTHEISAEAAHEAARISNVLAGWEAQAKADASWMPGDPLYPHPNERGPDAQTVRPMMHLADDSPLWGPRCVPCQVTWSGSSPCWVCGEDRPPAGLQFLRHMNERCHPAPVLGVQPAAGSLQSAFQERQSTLTRMMAAALDRTEQRLRLRALGIDPTDVRRIAETHTWPLEAVTDATIRAVRAGFTLDTFVHTAEILGSPRLAAETAELFTRGIDAAGLLHGLARRDWSRTVPLPIDGHAYHRRRRARARRRAGR